MHNLTVSRLDDTRLISWPAESEISQFAYWGFSMGAVSFDKIKRKPHIMSMLNLKQAWKTLKHVSHKDRIAITSIKIWTHNDVWGLTNAGQVFGFPLNLPGWWHLSLVEITRSTSGSLWCLATSIRNSLTCRLNSAYPAISPTTNISPPIICTKWQGWHKTFERTDGKHEQIAAVWCTKIDWSGCEYSRLKWYWTLTSSVWILCKMYNSYSQTHLEDAPYVFKVFVLQCEHSFCADLASS